MLRKGDGNVRAAPLAVSNGDDDFADLDVGLHIAPHSEDRAASIHVASLSRIFSELYPR